MAAHFLKEDGKEYHKDSWDKNCQIEVSMSNIIEKYDEKKEYLVCVDSDGCAMDTMDVKHFFAALVHV